MSSSKASLEPDFGDPYELLGLEQSASESEINKAFRKFSLQLHPDKQHGKTEREKEAVSKRFHNINQAKAFLLDPKQRQPYDVQRGSRQRRQQHEKARETSMTERRRQMKQDLAEREANLKSTTTTKIGKQRQKQQAEQDLLSKLRKEGKRRRDEYAEKAAEDEYQRSTKKQQTEKKSGIKQRQIRLKWSRKRISISPSEHSIAELFSSKFGKVVAVEMIGSKGNQAVVTFESASSCQPCVLFYAKHAEMRASLMGEQEEEDEPVAPSTTTATPHDREKLEDQRVRQAEERERLMREMMEQEENGGNTATKTTASSKQSPTNQQSAFQSFPLEFPVSEDTASMTPFEKLQYFERLIFVGRISKELLSQIQI